MASRDIGEATKVCTKCKVLFPATLDFFGRHPKGKHGLQSRCRGCHRALLRAHYGTASGKAARAAWLEKNNAAYKKWLLTYAAQPENKQKQAERSRRFSQTSKARAYQAAWIREKRRANPEWSRKILADRRSDPKKAAHDRAVRRRYLLRRLRRDAAFKLAHRTATDVRNALKRRPNTRQLWWEKALGYTVSDLRRHLEAQFIEGMTWRNHGTLWDIDHIKPLSSFRAESIGTAAFKAAWALANLRPLLSHLNRAKGAKLE